MSSSRKKGNSSRPQIKATSKNINSSKASKPKYQIPVSQVRSVIEESRLRVYDVACSHVKRAIDPDASMKHFESFIEAPVGTNVFRPTVQMNLNPDPLGRFTVVTNPNFYYPIMLTDYNRLPGKFYTGRRMFNPSSMVKSDLLEPPGRLEQDQVTYLGGIVPATILADPVSRSTFLPTYAQNIGGWVYHVDYALPARTAASAVGYVDLILNMSTQVSQGLLTLNLSIDGVMNQYTVTDTVSGFTHRWTWTIPATGNAMVVDFFCIQSFGTGYNGVERIYDEIVQFRLDDQSGATAPTRGTSEALFGVQSAIVPTVEASAEACICVAMQTWVEYQGSTLENGGTISGFRYPTFTHPFLGSAETRYAAVSSTPGHYNGPLKDGAVCWWAPDAIRDMTWKPLTESTTSNFCVITGIRDEPSERIVLHWDQILLVSTFSQAYAIKRYPCNPEAWAVYLTLISQLPGCVCNSKHKRIVQKVGEVLAKHRVQLTNAAHDIMSVGRAIAPIIGAVAAAL